MITKTRSSVVATGDQLRRAAFDEDQGSWSGYVLYGTAAGAQAFDALNESITYENPAHKTNGSCLHTKDDLMIFDSGSSTRVQETAGAAAGYYYTIVTSPKFIPALYHTVVRSVPTVTIREYKWSLWSAQAMESMIPTFSEGGESLVNFMLELKSLKDLHRLWRSKLPLLKNITGAHLNVSFGWLPFISDVQRIFGALKNFQKKVRKLQEESSKPRKRHFRRYLDTVDLPSDGFIGTADANGQFSRETTWLQHPLYCATADYVHVMPDMSLVMNQVAGFLDSLGVQLNASIIWNAIPYSFVVDWFFNVGDWMNQLRVDNLSIPVAVTGFCHSVKYEWRSQLWFHPSLSFDPDQVARHVSDRTRLYYERRKDIPSLNLFDSTAKTPNWKQVALGSSLVVQRF
jgi:hypothetical protein